MILGNVVNIKDAPYSAVGDGVADDTTAIQDAIEACFGALPAGNGNNPENNAGTLYFPPGIYAISQTLIFPSMSGGMVIGAGSRVTRFVYIGSYPNDGYSSSNYMMSLSGSQGGMFRGFSLDFDDAAGAHDTICFDVAAHSNGFPNDRDGVIQGTANTFFDIVTKNALNGFLLGFGDNAGNDAETFINCELYDHSGAGIAALNLNAISNAVFNCNFVRCGQDEVAEAPSPGVPTRGALVSNVGNFNAAICCKFEDSTSLDINQVNAPISVIGCHSTNSSTTQGSDPNEKYPWFVQNVANTYIAGLLLETPNAVDNVISDQGGGCATIMDGCDCAGSDGRIQAPGAFANDGFYYRGTTFGAADATTALSPVIWEPPYTVILDSTHPPRARPGRGPKAKTQGHYQDPNSWRFN